MTEVRVSNSLLAFALALGAVTSALVLATLLGAPVHLGSNIPTSDLMLDYAYGLLFAFAGYAILVIFPVSFPDRIALAIVWTVKILVVLVFMLFYEDFYWILDSYTYFELPQSAPFGWDGIQIGRGTDNLYNLIWLYYRVFPDSFHALKVFFSFVGLMAVYIFYRAGVLVAGKEDLRLFYILALCPSILFWSSILGKEPIALLGIAICAYGTATWHKGRATRGVILLAFGVLVAMLIRPWLGPILIAPLLANIVFGRYRLINKMLIVTLAAGALVYALNALWDQLAIETTQDLLETIDTRSRGLSEGGSAQEVPADLTQPVEVIRALPLAMFTALFRPLPGEIPNAFGTLAGAENLVLLVLLAFALRRFRFAELKEPVVLWATTLVLAWTSTYAFISYANLGGAVRFLNQPACQHRADSYVSRVARRIGWRHLRYR